MSLLDGCSDSCGWTAALIALVCYGTYGVPIKQTLVARHHNNDDVGNSHKNDDVNPLVFQTYKTVVMLVVAPFLVALVSTSNSSNSNTNTNTVQWWRNASPGWGLVSGLLWVLGGTCGVVGVRWAGLSTAVATWASVMIVINFVWGILIFREPVASVVHTVGAFGLLGIGLIGMSHFAAPPPPSSARSVLLHEEEEDENENDDGALDNDPQHRPLVEASADIAEEEEEVEEMFVNSTGNNDNDNGAISMSNRRRPNNNHTDKAGIFLDQGSPHAGNSIMIRRSLSSPDDNNDSSLLVDDQEDDDDGERSISNTPFFHADTHVRLGGRVYTKRRVGILAAVANGILAGSSLIPVHYVKKQGLGGATYMISYAVGAFAANLLVWIIYYAVVFVRLQPLRLPWSDRLVRAAGDMPDPRWEQLWKPGICAGLLLATAMFGSILAVTYLGQGIGNSVIQAKIIISGMWGIFYYKEIRDPHAIRNWFLSATLSVVAIIWLSRERIAAKAAAGNHRDLLSLMLNPGHVSSC